MIINDKKQQTLPTRQVQFAAHASELTKSRPYEAILLDRHAQLVSRILELAGKFELTLIMWVSEIVSSILG